jgi:hypothetical protein
MAILHSWIPFSALGLSPMRNIKQFDAALQQKITAATRRLIENCAGQSRAADTLWRGADATGAVAERPTLR